MQQQFFFLFFNLMSYFTSWKYMLIKISLLNPHLLFISTTVLVKQHQALIMTGTVSSEMGYRNPAVPLSLNEHS